ADERLEVAADDVTSGLHSYRDSNPFAGLRIEPLHRPGKDHRLKGLDARGGDVLHPNLSPERQDDRIQVDATLLDETGAAPLRLERRVPLLREDADGLIVLALGELLRKQAIRAITEHPE